jgi:hypothetical protein
MNHVPTDRMARSSDSTAMPDWNFSHRAFPVPVVEAGDASAGLGV